MTQADIARGLNLSPALISKLKRQGMPVHSIEAAAAWRRKHVAPYVSAYPPAPPPPPRPARPAPPRPLVELLLAEPLAHPADVLDALVRENLLMPKTTAPTLLRVLTAAALARLDAGEALGDVVQPLAYVLQALDDERRVLPATLAQALGLTGEATAP